MMKKTWKLPSLVTKVLIPAFALFAFTQCSDDTELKPEQATVAEPMATTASSEDEPVVSLTLDGLYTELVSTVDCKKCDYIVPANATTVDGTKIGIKPGQAICLDAAIKYGNLELINLIGEENKPIIVAYGVRTLDGKELLEEDKENI